MELYIYYRVRAEDEDRFHPRMLGMQRQLAGRTGVRAGLKLRPEDRDGLHTWMEVYAGLPEGFDAALSEALAASGAAGLIVGERRTELFMDMNACA